MLKSKMLMMAIAVCLTGVAWLHGQGSGVGSLTTQDHIDIHVYAQYNETIDDGDAEGWVTVWTDDGDFNGFEGRDALMRFARHYLDNQDGATPRSHRP